MVMRDKTVRVLLSTTSAKRHYTVDTTHDDLGMSYCGPVIDIPKSLYFRYLRANEAYKSIQEELENYMNEARKK